MSYLDQITVGSTTYDIQDSTAAASLAVDGSTLSLKDRNNSTLSSITLPSGLPSVSSSDDGKYLGVDDGDWAILHSPTEFYYGAVEPTNPDIKFWFNPIGANPVHDLPSGGSIGQFLIKTANTDYSADWSTISVISSSEIDLIMEG